MKTTGMHVDLLRGLNFRCLVLFRVPVRESPFPLDMFIPSHFSVIFFEMKNVILSSLGPKQAIPQAWLSLFS